MSKFTCTIDMDNAAFEDSDELPRLLQQTAGRLAIHDIIPGTTIASGVILDSNGNRVGGWSVD